MLCSLSRLILILLNLTWFNLLLLLFKETCNCLLFSLIHFLWLDFYNKYLFDIGLNCFFYYFLKLLVYSCFILDNFLRLAFNKFSFIYSLFLVPFYLSKDFIKFIRKFTGGESYEFFIVLTIYIFLSFDFYVSFYRLL